MAGSVNKVILLGRLGRDPEARTFQSGDRVVSFSMATDETWKDKNTGERKSRVEWSNISIFNEGLGKVAESYLRKGSKVYIEGQLQTREWEKDGVKHRMTEVVVPRFGGALTLLDSPKDREQSSGQQEEKPVPGQRNLRVELDDEVPFAPEWR